VSARVAIERYFVERRYACFISTAPPDVIVHRRRLHDLPDDRDGAAAPDPLSSAFDSLTGRSS
jgi:hypothetical protein